MTKLGMILADIHFGASDPKRLYDELEEMVLNKIDSLPILDFIVIAGDIFHFKVYFNSGASRYCGKFIHELLKRTEKHNTQIVFVEGTNSHDNKQMDAMYEFIDNPRLKIVNEVTEDVLCDDISVLYIPEEYVVDQDEYYKKYFEGKFYDLIIGHGMVDKMWFSKSDSNQEMVTRVPVFKVSDLLSKCTNCYFGHIHTHKEYGEDDRFKYISSFTRWQFGEEEDKGYMLVTINPKTKKIVDEFIVNYMAPTFMTCMVDIRGTLTLEQVNHIIDEEMSRYKESDLLRLIINISKSMDNFSMVRDFIMNTYGNLHGVKLVIGLDIPEDDMNTMKESMTQKQIMNDYVFDKTISLEERVSIFIKDKMNKDITAEEVRCYLNELL